MNNNQQPKPDPKGKAIASIVLGISAVVLPVAVLISKLAPLVNKPHAGGVLGGILLIFGFPLIFMVIAGLIAIILGIIGLKSTKRNFALTGIILAIITLVFELLFFFLFLPSPQ